MTVMEFIKLEKSGAMYKVINASLPGYMTSGKVLIEGDINVIKNMYAEKQLEGFSAGGKSKITLYIKA